MAPASSIPPLVDTAWLAARLGAPELRVVDGSWYLPGSGREARLEYERAHIPGAVFFDLDQTSDRSTPLPHMLPTPAAFEERMAVLGIGSEHQVVVYDGSGVNLSAPRVWWTFRAFGHRDVAVLDGGFGKWRREGRPVERGVVRLPRARFTARLDPALVRDLEAVRANLERPAAQVVDARSPGRFAGTEPEPRPGLRGGHIPGSRNLPFDSLVREDGTVLAPAELRRRFEAAGVDLARPVILSCGSGTSACALALGLELLGHRAYAVYDGSWAEWGGRSDTPVERGAPTGETRPAPPSS
ncbi:MAG TPA: 3-mercaptopyruvate sulfurtransferase [Gemmatimonadales bacterium]|nr:3-mercaptopyruvate sulfurtransferase [Gemmatimonadales bacterium]